MSYAKRRIEEQLDRAAAEAVRPSPRTFYWYLSFVARDPERFLGGCVVESSSGANSVGLATATTAAWGHGVNPGGSVRGTCLGPVGETDLAGFEPNRLYSRAEIEALGGARDWELDQ